ncbi:MAG: ABC transporter ATP-binding protein [Deltaproteobacteria bacterium]|nr:ABC transporter ATP-binding protein [Deltaproteobacteria bacterium]
MLRIEGIGKHFGGVPALSDVTFRCREGWTTALIGPNGAGKSTLINCISGILAPDTGQIHLQGLRLDGLPAHRRPFLGVGRTFQNLALFPRLTVLENVLCGLTPQGEPSMLRSLLRLPATRHRERLLRLKALEMLDAFGLTDKSQWPVSILSYGDRKRVELARALVSEPRLLLLDEPVAGLNAEETARIGTEIRRLHGAGLTILLVEHDMDLVMSVSDHIVVLDSGRAIASGTPGQIRSDPRVIEAYLGRMSATA